MEGQDMRLSRSGILVLLLLDIGIWSLNLWLISLITR
jgi:hypothetical protein